MIFTDYSRFHKRERPIKKNKDKYCSIKFKDGTTFKQVTTFEEGYILSEEKGREEAGYGAWFASEKDAIFLTPEIISVLLDESKAVFVQGDIYNLTKRC